MTLPESRRLGIVRLLVGVGSLAVVAVLTSAILPRVSALARQPAGVVYAYDAVSHGASAPSAQFDTLPSTDAMRSCRSTAGDRVSPASLLTVVGAEDAGGLDIAEGNAGHIFRDAPGHLAQDTAENRQLLQCRRPPKIRPTM